MEVTTEFVHVLREGVSRSRNKLVGPKAILMHPEDCKLMIERAAKRLPDEFYIDGSNFDQLTDIKFQDIPVYRSLDIEQGSFKIF